MIEKYPNNFWTRDLDYTHLKSPRNIVFREKDDDMVAFCNVDYSTVKVSSEIDSVEDVQVYEGLENLKYEDGYRVDIENCSVGYELYHSRPIQHLVTNLSPSC